MPEIERGYAASITFHSQYGSKRHGACPKCVREAMVEYGLRVPLGLPLATRAESIRALVAIGWPKTVARLRVDRRLTGIAK